jgi:hypothetical protein
MTTTRVAKTGANLPKDHKIYQMATNYLDQMTIKYTKRPIYTKTFHSKAFQNLPELKFLV